MVCELLSSVSDQESIYRYGLIENMCVRVHARMCVFRSANTVAIDSRMDRPMGCSDGQTL